MPIELSESRGEVGHFDVRYGGSTARIWFYPDEMTMDWCQEMASSGENLMKMCELTASVLADWDIYENGAKVSLTEEGLGTIPQGLMLKVVEGMNTEANAKAELVSARELRKRHGFVGSVLEEIFKPTEKPREKPPEEVEGESRD